MNWRLCGPSRPGAMYAEGEIIGYIIEAIRVGFMRKYVLKGYMPDDTPIAELGKDGRVFRTVKKAVSVANKIEANRN